VFHYIFCTNVTKIINNVKKNVVPMISQMGNMQLQSHEPSAVGGIRTHPNTTIC